MVALALWVAGNVAMLLSQPNQALTYYQQAELLFDKQHDPLSAARMCVGKVEALCDLGIHDEAIRAGEAAILVLQSRQDDSDQQRLASLLDTLGANYERLGWLVEALANSERALGWWNTHVTADYVPAARAQINAAVVKTLLGQYIEAHQDFLAACATLTQATHDLAALTDVARIDMNLAWLEVVRRNTPDIIKRVFAQAQISRAHIDPHLDSVDFAFFDLLQAEWHLSNAEPTLLIEQNLVELAQRCQEAGLAHESARAAIQLARAALKRDDAAAAQRWHRIKS